MRSSLFTLALCALLTVASTKSLAPRGEAQSSAVALTKENNKPQKPQQLTDEEKEKLKQSFKDGDTNGDGFHELAEIVETLVAQARASLIEGFNRADANSDGLVDQNEYLKFAPDKSATSFKETDTNNDGTHNLDEQLAHYAASKAFQHDREAATKTAKAIMRVDDKNGDGKLSEEEFMVHSGKLMLAVQNEIAFNHADKDGDGLHTTEEIIEEIMRVGGFEKRDGRFMESGIEDAFKAADQNNDGVVTKGEFLKAWPNATAEDFERGDTNKDGKTTLEEAMNHQSKHLEETYQKAQEEAVRHIKVFDKNGDGKLNLKEKNHAVSISNRDQHFKSTDMDGDGFHTQGEIMEEIVRQAGYSPLIDGKKNGKLNSKGKQRFYLPTDFLQAFLAADKDGDEMVTKEEFLNAFGQDKETEFKDHDTDGDGKHSLDEQAQKIFESEEFKKLHVDAEKLSARFIKDADKDGDGRISKEEFDNHIHNDTENEL